jgi:Ser-Thr-rich glycosyl-phosphatidyl-inositol-anchored membrane family
VSLILRQGPSNNIGIVGTIADSIQNTGEYFWSIPSNLPSANNYAIEIIVGPAANVSNVGPDAYNFTPLLPLINNATGPATGNVTVSSTILQSNTTTASMSATTSSSPSTTTGSASQGSSTVTTTSLTASTANPSQTSTSTATHASAATRIVSGLMGGHGFITLIVTLAIGIVALF